MKMIDYNPSLPHACSHDDYLLASCFGLVDPWTEDAFEVTDFTVFPHGVLNDYGMEVLAQALESGWNHQNFFFYRRLGVNWLNSCIDDLVRFSNLMPVKDPELSKMVIEHLQRIDPETPSAKQARRASELRILGGRGKGTSAPADLESRRDVLFRYFGQGQGLTPVKAHLLSDRGAANSFSDFRELDLESVWDRFNTGRLNESQTDLTSFHKAFLITEDLEHLSESEFHQEFCDPLMKEDTIQAFRELISVHGVHVGEWFDRAVWPRILRSLNKELGDDGSFIILYEQAYGHFIGDNTWRAIRGLAGHLYWQLILDALKDPETVDSVIRWIDSFSDDRKCSICGELFNLVSRQPWIDYGSNGTRDICLDCPVVERPDSETLGVRIKEFVEACGFAPPDGFTPMDNRVTSRLSESAMKDMVSAWSRMGGISHAKISLRASWFECMAKAGALPDGAMATSRGIRSLAKDGCECLSNAEQQIDDWLSANDVKHVKEPYYPKHPLYNPSGRRRADWLAEGVWIEYFGLAGDSVYDRKCTDKISLANES